MLLFLSHGLLLQIGVFCFQEEFLCFQEELLCLPTCGQSLCLTELLPELTTLPAAALIARGRSARATPTHDIFVSDLLSLVKEGIDWNPTLQDGRAKHARVWRGIFATCRSRSPALPAVRFQWTPARRDIDDVVAAGSSIEDWLGNAWADFFAKCGAASHMVAETVGESVRLALAEHKKTTRANRT